MALSRHIHWKIQNKTRERADPVPWCMNFVIGNGPRRHQEMYELAFKHFAVSINVVFIASVLVFMSLLCLCFLLQCKDPVWDRTPGLLVSFSHLQRQVQCSYLGMERKGDDRWGLDQHHSGASLCFPILVRPCHVSSLSPAPSGCLKVPDWSEAGLLLIPTQAYKSLCWIDLVWYLVLGKDSFLLYYGKMTPDMHHV